MDYFSSLIRKKRKKKEQKKAIFNLVKLRDELEKKVEELQSEVDEYTSSAEKHRGEGNEDRANQILLRKGSKENLMKLIKEHVGRVDNQIRVHSGTIENALNCVRLSE